MDKFMRIKEVQLRRADTRGFNIFFKLSKISRWGKVSKPRAGFSGSSFSEALSQCPCLSALGSHKTVDFFRHSWGFQQVPGRVARRIWGWSRKSYVGQPLLCRVSPQIPNFSNNVKCVSLMVFTSLKTKPSVLHPVKQFKVTDAEALNHQVHPPPVLTIFHILHHR